MGLQVGCSSWGKAWDMEGWQQVSLVETLKAVHMVGCPKGGGVAGGCRRQRDTSGAPIGRKKGKESQAAVGRAAAPDRDPNNTAGGASRRKGRQLQGCIG